MKTHTEKSGVYGHTKEQEERMTENKMERRVLMILEKYWAESMRGESDSLFRQTGQGGEGISPVIPATLYDGKSLGKSRSSCNINNVLLAWTQRNTRLHQYNNMPAERFSLQRLHQSVVYMALYSKLDNSTSGRTNQSQSYDDMDSWVTIRRIIELCLKGIRTQLPSK